MHENRETSGMPAMKVCRRTAGEGSGHTARVYVSEESHSGIVPMNHYRLVREVILATQGDKETFKSWLSKTIEPEALIRWFDEDVHQRWGTKAAVRVLGIAMSGCDVAPVGNVKNQSPSEIKTRKLDQVPGLVGPVENIFGISQVLSWLAGQRAEIGEDFEWRSQVQDLMNKLTR